MESHLLNLPDELLCMIIAYLDPCANVPIRYRQDDTKTYVTQLILIRWVSCAFLRPASKHPFWMDPKSNLSQLVPRYKNLAPTVADRKVGKLYALLFEDAFIRQALDSRTSWVLSEPAAVPLVQNHIANGSSVTRLDLSNLRETLGNAIRDFGKVCPNVRTLALYDKWLWGECLYVQFREAWPDLQHLSIDLNNWNYLYRGCPMKLETYDLRFHAGRETCFNVCTHLPRSDDGSPIETLTDLTISNSTFTCHGTPDGYPDGYPDNAADLSTLNGLVNLRRLTVPAINSYLLKQLTHPNLKLEFSYLDISIVNEDEMEDLLMFLNYSSCLRSLETLVFTYESSVFTDENCRPVQETLRAFASQGVKVEEYRRRGLLVHRR